MDDDGGLMVRFDYRTDLFCAETMRRWTADFAVLLAGLAAADPATPVTRVPLVAGAEGVEILESWNATAVEVPDRLVHELVSKVARRHSDRPAVGCRDALLTYGELDRRSDDLALALRDRGVGPGGIVALCLERSPDMAIAVFGPQARPAGPAWSARRPTGDSRDAAALPRGVSTPISFLEPPLSLPFNLRLRGRIRSLVVDELMWARQSAALA